MKSKKKKRSWPWSNSFIWRSSKRRKKRNIPNNTSIKVNIGDLSPNKFQPRVHFDPNKMEELSNSIKKNGIIQPIAVREDKVDPGRYEIVAGERRWILCSKSRFT